MRFLFDEQIVIRSYAKMKIDLYDKDFIISRIDEL